ncbi:hypothetical protein BDA96_10G259400 [Sorghum bicolor]|uniref:Phytosulfokine-beta n=2 Tax=Sorghum bicolor TaxID=4558 RepID=A0A921U1X2_SORBI|nr:phytosulfokines 1 [Sorghum bicolor]KAG0515214.1 hypothetical protein BDA96_10G259400 [Sorghum bicolor]KXG20421.1 hypothetical protein SORBI_3010G198900 [Sorghum bicolor]|eukprot:XP_002438707.2 phytosulfokines 1 [Sorghum bicolor]
MMHGRRTAMAVACLLCMVVALLLVQDVQSRKLLWTEQEKKEITHGGLGNHGAAAGRSTTLEPCSDVMGGGTGNADKGELPCDDTSKWTEMHTDYIYTQDVKQP